MAKGKTRSRELESTWRQTLTRHRQSGLTVREFCRVEEIKESAFHYWKRELKRRAGDCQSSARRRKTSRQSSPALVPVTITSGSPAPIEIALPGGTTLRVSSDCEQSLLRMVVSALATS